MMIRRWETLQKSRLTETPVFAVDLYERRAPSGLTGKFFVADMPDWVNVVALTPDGDLVLIYQYRQGTDAVTLEIPGGIVDDGESFIDAARRELREETGFEAAELHQIGVVEPNPALQTNRCATFLALDARPTAETDFDDEEEIEIVTVPYADVARLVTSGQITHALVVAALYHYEQWRR